MKGKRNLNDNMMDPPSVTDRIYQLEMKMDKLYRKIQCIEEFGSMAAPLTILLENQPGGAAIPGAEDGDDGDGDRDDMKVDGLGDIVLGINRIFYGQEVPDMLLDINTAGNYVSISGDRKTVTKSHTDQGYPSAPGRFQYNQVLSTRSFPSGQHHWDVEGSESGYWRVGVSYPSIERFGDQSHIGDNIKSWCLYRWYDNMYTMRYNSDNINLPHVPSCRRFRISLDYEAGRLSFYELSDPIRHLHTFTATFTEPLYGAFRVIDGAWIRIIS